MKSSFATLLVLQTSVMLLASPGRAADSGTPVGYYDGIKPLLAVHCYKCHAGEKPKAGLLLDTLQHALA